MSGIVETVKSWTSKLTSAHTALSELTEAEQALRRRLSALAGEAARARSAPSAPDELKRAIGQHVRTAGNVWKRQTGGAPLLASFSEGLQDDGTVRHPAWPDGPTLAVMGLAPVSLNALCAIVPDTVTAALVDAATLALDGQEAGPRLAERQRRLREIADEEAALRRDHAELVDQARRHGIALEHLPEERARRRRIAQRHAAWEADVRLNAGVYDRHPDQQPPEPERPEAGGE